MGMLSEALLKTIIYFDCSDFPLTEEEAFRYLWNKKGSFDEVRQMLQTLVLEGELLQKWGLYYLPGREEIIEKRRAAVVYNDQKLKRASSAARFIKAVPFLKAIMVCNSVGREVAKPESDIDLFIVAEKNRIWIVRLFCNLILKLFRLRTSGNHEANRMCLSFFVDTTHINLAPWRAIQEDIHFAYWLHQMVPIYDPENWYEKVLQANTWTDGLLPNRKKTSLHPEMKLGKLGKMVKLFFEKSWRGLYGNLVEGQAKEIQRIKLPFSVKEKMHLKDNGVVIEDGIIKLHEHDARLAYYETWQKKVGVVVGSHLSSRAKREISTAPIADRPPGGGASK